LSGRVSKQGFYGKVFSIATERSPMENNQIPFYARILFIIGISVALAVALDNIAIGIGVATVFFAALVIRRNKNTETSGENNE
jgi:zinc transporter ZupT